jgi:rhodanese-related sulfurtransferase
MIRTLLLLLCFSASAWSLAEVSGSAGNPIVSPEQIGGARIVNSEQLIEAVTDIPGLVLIDSRVPADRTDGFIEGSINLTDTDTSCTSLAGIAPGRATPVLFYCNGIRCGRSARAARVAVACGYSNVLWFRNGMEEWLEKEYPLVR